MRIMKSLVWGFVLTACVTVSGVAEDKETLIGKQLSFDYGDYAYAITILSPSELNWRLTKGDYPGPKEGNETYFLTEITEDIAFISWVESSDLGIYTVINLKSSELFTHARDKGTTHVSVGTVTIME